MSLARTSVVPAVYCLQCGGPTDEQSRAHRRCSYCHAPLIPLDHPDPRTSVPCGRCAAFVAADSKYCGQCGHAVRARKARGDTEHPCPGCGHEVMHQWSFDGEQAGLELAACARCGGCFVDHDTLERFIEREHQRFERSLGAEDPRLDQVKRFNISPCASVENRKCPHCQQTMARRNYGRLSGVIIDQCRVHGAYFDAGELAQVLAFVRSGGLEVDRKRRAKAKQREAQVRANLASMNPDGRVQLREHGARGLSLDFHDLLEIVVSLVKWVARFISR